jgi:hypothetical protein
LADGAAGFRQGFSYPALLRYLLVAGFPFAYGSLTLFGLPSHAVRLKNHGQLYCRPYNPSPGITTALVWALSRSLATTWEIIVYFLLLGVLRCFSSPRLPRGYLNPTILRLQHSGFPHSDTCGSMAARASPQLFAACRVLPRLQKPRHPPCALCNLICYCNLIS